MARARYHGVLPQELVAEILSWLPVKRLMRLRCICKSWNSIMFDPTFIKLHLQRSPKDTPILFTSHIKTGKRKYRSPCFLHYCSVQRLLENPLSNTLDGGLRIKNKYTIVGTCNGLICLSVLSHDDDFDVAWVRFWNPATRIRSQKSPCLQSHRLNDFIYMQLGFGYDDSIDTYKVVAMIVSRKSLKVELQVLSFGDKYYWRKIADLPEYHLIRKSEGHFVSGTVNWMTQLGANHHVIFSFDLRKETYMYLSLPKAFEFTTYHGSQLVLLSGCLCLSHGLVGTHFFLWQMKEFGVEDSWTLLMKVSYEHFPILTVNFSQPFPLCMSKNGDVLLLVNDYPEFNFVLYNRKDNRVVDHIETPRYWVLLHSGDYVQSLVLPY